MGLYHSIPLQFQVHPYEPGHTRFIVYDQDKSALIRHAKRFLCASLADEADNFLIRVAVHKLHTV